MPIGYWKRIIRLVRHPNHVVDRYEGSRGAFCLTPLTAYYLPPDSIKIPLTPTPRSTYCEWKGVATYYSTTAPGSSSTGKSVDVSNRIWSYESPTSGFEAIAGYFSFYAGPWNCFVDGEAVQPQPGDFYGGWVTSEVEGIVKGAHGNWDPVV
ncbi:hypothetical protein CSHISOI_04552 [Colletotrichum shisoi]|uniref:DUF427 domain-containing protein n=1 Tax=Colletotrichum shisoi TaxID=2078593 RepID=A0A5Q4BVC2_9PEZI|nr:hypothetical protein CSHISOI_04552 [Colletotrichum shisoi]